MDIGLITSREFGSGAFTLTEHNPAERTVMDSNPDYWRAGVPYLDRVILFYMPEQTSRIQALKSGAIDVILEPPFSALSDLDANPNIIVQEAPTAGVRVLDFHTDREPFNNKDLRKAFQYAVDRTFVRQASLFGRGVNGNDHPVGPNDEYYWDDQPIITQDIPRAKAYLDAAGYPNGIDVVLTTTDVTQKLEIALAFKESVAPAGIRVEINNADRDHILGRVLDESVLPLHRQLVGPASCARGPQLTAEERYSLERVLLHQPATGRAAGPGQ